ncbi:MAG: nucleotidyltransferase family protein [Armatimonadetes bacterium]|nr:nucleotidyltransferase family protein [Armatimonadota bacterium]
MPDAPAPSARTDAASPIPLEAAGLRAHYPFETAFLRIVRFAPDVPSLSPEEWGPVAQLARRERLSPLAFAAVREAREGIVPPGVAEALEAACGRAGAPAADLYRQLAEVTGALRSAGIDTVLLKGAALARFVYHDEALRPLTDLDLLVRHREIDRVHVTLTGLGYAIVGGRPSEADRTWRHGRAYYDPEGRRVPVDVHWRYAGYPHLMAVDYEGIFARTSTVLVHGHPAGVPSAPDMIVALSISFLRELWYGKPRLLYLRDITEVCGRRPVDWARLPQIQVETPLLASPLYLSLAAAAALLGAPVPPEALGALRPRRWPAVSQFLLARVTRNAMRQERAVAALLQVALMRGLNAGTADLLRWLWRLIAVPRPLAPSQRRWLRHLAGGRLTGPPPVD